MGRWRKLDERRQQRLHERRFNDGRALAHDQLPQHGLGRLARRAGERSRRVWPDRESVCRQERSFGLLRQRRQHERRRLLLGHRPFHEQRLDRGHAAEFAGHPAGPLQGRTRRYRLRRHRRLCLVRPAGNPVANRVVHQLSGDPGQHERSGRRQRHHEFRQRGRHRSAIQPVGGIARPAFARRRAGVVADGVQFQPLPARPDRRHARQCH